MDRRGLLRSMAMLGLTPASAILGGCTTVRPELSIKQFDAVDAHCHMFNASDLPVASFLAQVALGDQLPAEEAGPRSFRKAATPTQPIIELAVRLLGAGQAPSAEREYAVLTGRIAGNSASLSIARAGAGVRRDVARLLKMASQARSLKAQDMPAPAAISPELERSLVQAAGLKSSEILSADRSDEKALEIARSAYFGDSAISRYYRWFTLFRLYRHTLLDELDRFHKSNKTNVALYTPAMVDFGRWLNADNTDPKGSSFQKQIEVMGRISARSTGPLMHGYVCFDPLRQVFSEAGRDKGQMAPLDLVRSALDKHGFLGIKLYPPMGFLPLGNGRALYPRYVQKIFGDALPRLIEDKLKQVYALALEYDAPILAHATASNSPRKEYAPRADPGNWKPVLEQFPGLRLQLAHFASFRPNDPKHPHKDFTDTEEWRFGQLLKLPGSRNVVADISFFSETLSGEGIERIGNGFRAWIKEFDKDCERLVFGSDWIMLAKERDYKEYGSRVRSFLEGLGLSDRQLQNIFRDNSLRMAGLVKGEATALRLQKFRGNDSMRLPLLEAPSLLSRIGQLIR